MGLHRAGFDVTGVDLHPQPEYPFAFCQADALTVELGGFDMIWSSPPCQQFTAHRRRRGHVGEYPNFIPAMRDRLENAGTPWVIENVPGAPLVNAVTLCGSMFGLGVRRHRLFESSFPMLQPSCNHAAQTGSYPQATNRSNRRRTVEVGVWRIPLEVQRTAMGIGWMSLESLSQAIPPAYAEHIGRAARRYIGR
jgi:DNA (cytosine-5)-methyltransferase 1